MFNFKRFFILQALFIAMILAVSCDPDVVPKAEETVNYVLTGYWKSSYGDGFEIKEGMYYQYDDADRKISFTGSIAKEEKETLTSGYLVIKIINAGSWEKDVDKYLVVRWKDYGINTVKQSTASKYPDDLANGKDTIEEAVATYTIDDGYFGYYGDYDKQ